MRLWKSAGTGSCLSVCRGCGISSSLFSTMKGWEGLWLSRDAGREAPQPVQHPYTWLFPARSCPDAHMRARQLRHWKFSPICLLAAPPAHWLGHEALSGELKPDGQDRTQGQLVCTVSEQGGNTCLFVWFSFLHVLNLFSIMTGALSSCYHTHIQKKI